MPSHSKPGWRRLTKTRGTFEAIPTLRVPGKDTHNAMSRKAPSPKTPVHYADPTLFPGRRLDRRQQSTYSMVSGNSGQSCIDQITLPGSCRVRGPGSTAGSTKLSHISLPAVGASHNRTFVSDGNDPWGSERQDSPLTINRRHNAGAEEEEDHKVSSAPVLPQSSILPPQSSFAKVSRWQLANFTQVNQRGHKPMSLETRDILVESPDSERTKDSEQQPAVHRDMSGHQPRPEQTQQRKEHALHEHSWGKHVAPPPTPKVTTTFPPQQHHHGARHLNPRRRPAHTPAVSPTAPADPGPRLNKILWALAPDEHANTSEAGASHMPSSLQGTSIHGDNKPARTLHKTVTVTDLEVDSDVVCSVPETPRNPHLTEQLLMDHNESGTWSRDDRIHQWLAECDQETNSQSLPNHLPDIQYTFKFLKLNSS